MSIISDFAQSGPLIIMGKDLIVSLSLLCQRIQTVLTEPYPMSESLGPEEDLIVCDIQLEHGGP